MEINITRLVDSDNVDLMDYSASAMELGQDAGRITWNNALESEHVLVSTEEELQEARDYIRGFGAWSDEEIDGWTPQEVNALILQFVAGSLRRYLEARNSGVATLREHQESDSHQIYESDEGQYYFYMGN